MSLNPSFTRLYRRSRYADRRSADQDRANIEESFSAAAVAFVLKHHQDFRAHVIREIAAMPSPREVQPHNHTSRSRRCVEWHLSAYGSSHPGKRTISGSQASCSSTGSSGSPRSHLQSKKILSLFAYPPKADFGFMHRCNSPLMGIAPVIGFQIAPPAQILVKFAYRDSADIPQV